MLFFGTAIYVAVLLLNAIVVLSEDRFLARINMSSHYYNPPFGQGPDQSMTAKIRNLLGSVRTVMRVPLIVVNTLVIVYELILG